MKAIINILIFSLSFSLIQVKAQDKMDTIRIKTSAVCNTCKKTIEHNMSFEKGVKSSDQNVQTGILTVVYRTDKTNPDKIREAVTKIGYDADSLKADPKAFNRLPDCCKDPEGHH